MQHTTLSLSLLALSLCSTAAAAQQVTFRGKVEDVSGTQNQFVVDCTDVSIASNDFNLNLAIGQQFELTGEWNGSATSPFVLVTGMTPVAESFEIGGGGKIGKLNNLSVTGPAGQVAGAWISTGSGFTPLGDLGVGLVDPSLTILMGVAPIPPAGTRQFDFFIPDDPALIGFELHGQGVVASPAAGTAWLTNADCKELQD